MEAVLVNKLTVKKLEKMIRSYEKDRYNLHRLGNMHDYYWYEKAANWAKEEANNAQSDEDKRHYQQIMAHYQEWMAFFESHTPRLESWRGPYLKYRQKMDTQWNHTFNLLKPIFLIKE